MNFKERISPTTVTKVLMSAVPYVVISKNALAKMFLYVDTCFDEVGWLGTAYRNERQIEIHDVFLFDQEVHSTTTEITPQGLSDFATELLSYPDGMDVWNNMKVWGHSHVRMAVNPSAQDDIQMATFKDGGHDWFIRIIANKNGELKVDLYEYATGVIFLDLPWFIEENAQEKQVREQMELIKKEYEDRVKALQGLLDSHTGAPVAEYKEEIQAEMKVKVRKKSYLNQAKQSNWWEKNEKKTSETKQEPKTELTKENGGTNTDTHESTIKNNFRYINMLDNDDDVATYFQYEDLLEMCDFTNLNDLEAHIGVNYHYYDYFSESDLEIILRVAMKAGKIFDVQNGVDTK